MTEEDQAGVSPEKQDATHDDSKDAADAVDDSKEVTIQLDQFLQGCGVATGGQAKRIIQAGEVLVNDQIETRRKKKLVVGDEVTLDSEVYIVAVDDGTDLETQE